MDYSIAELMAVVLSRQIKDGEVVGGGAGLPVLRAAQLLAHLHHGPNMKFHLIVWTNLFHEQNLSLSLFENTVDWQQVRWAEAYWMQDEMFDDMRLFRKRVMFMSGLQIDKYGNLNLLGIGKDYNRLDFRGPGNLGAPTMGTYVNRYYLVVPKHDRRSLVDHCDYVTCVGWGKGGKDARTKLGFPGDGPVGCMTPLCYMDFEEESKQMRLKSLHPGVTVEQVIENTGFKPIIPDSVPETEAPTENELQILRTRIDTEGTLRKLKL